MDKGLLRQGARMGSLAWILVPLIVAGGASPAVAGPTTRVSVDSAGGEGNFGSANAPSISATGRFVAFDSFATTLVPGDTNGVFDVFVHDRKTGGTTRVSVDSAGGEATGGVFLGSFGPSISASGRFVAFASLASNLVPGDTNEDTDVFVHDRKAPAKVAKSADLDVELESESDEESDDPDAESE
jgi:hypothetical protein